jgi:hypothetical protein
MKKLITMVQGVIEAQAIHFWYEILEKEFKQRMWDVTCRNPSFGLATKAKGVARVRA